MWNRRLLLLILCWLSATSVLAQQILVRGTVRDRNTREALSAVNVFIPNTQIGTTTNELGHFHLTIPREWAGRSVRFQHVSYEPAVVPIDSLLQNETILLIPRVIPLQEVAVEGVPDRPKSIQMDLPQSLEIVPARRFSMKGFVDIGDLLRADQSVQVEEELSGKKTIGVRAGNPDEVVVLFNGIKLNPTYDNVFDFSLLDFEDIRQVEIIRGSNTVLFGPEAFSGVINVVPYTRRDYALRFLQRIGTYNSGNWGLSGYRQVGNVLGSVSVRKGGWRRRFMDVPTGNDLLTNRSDRVFANINWQSPGSGGTTPDHSLGVMALSTKLDFDNQRDGEYIVTRQSLYSLRYEGIIPVLQRFIGTISYRKNREDQQLSVHLPADYLRTLDDAATQLQLETHRNVGRLDWFLAYQLQNARLDLTDRRETTKYTVNLESARLSRLHHGLASVLKYHGGTGSDFFKTLDIGLSLRHDRVSDRLKNVESRTSSSNGSIFTDHAWTSTLVKFSMNLFGYHEGLAVDSYLNMGRNIKFPTLFQQVSSPMILTDPANRPHLEPEMNNSLELGCQIMRQYPAQSALYGWQFHFNYFQNQYDNKFRLFSSPGVPIVFYDNTQSAKISGVDTKVGLFLFQKQITAEIGLSKYAISEKAAFPFKSDMKMTANLLFDFSGYSVQIHWFKESEQTGWLRFPNGQFLEVALPAQMNVDLHFSKSFDFWRFNASGNISLRNLLSDDTALQGLAIRDRRIYLTFAVQI